MDKKILVPGNPMKVVVAEKPSVARSIAGVIGANVSKDGYIEGNGYIVTWCYGHLVELAYPEEYNEQWKQWKLESLPMFPTYWKYNVKKEVIKQYKLLKELFSRSDVTAIVCATDAGREGELIFRNTYNLLGCKKKIERLWISSMTDEAIADGFKNLKNGDNYISLFNAARAREHTDWLTGMNLSRLYALKCGYYGGPKFAIGRVMTPTLRMIVDRDREISNFKREKYFEVHLVNTDKGINAVLDEKFSLESDAKQIVEKCSTGYAKVLAVKKESKSKTAPHLYDLNTLQRDCNRYLGFSAQKTLDIAQELYEKKLTTYPRTDSQYITHDMEAKFSELVKICFSYLDYSSKTVDIKRNINDSKVSDHHAIIPTGYDNFGGISDDSMMVYKLITLRVVCSVSSAYLYDSINMKIVCSGYTFNQSGTMTIDDGYKEFEKKYKLSQNIKVDDKECDISVLNDGDEFIGTVKAEEKFTKPKQHYTEDTLLSAMEKAGGKDISDEVERKGLGTSATRAGVIEKLIKDNYIERSKKNLIATEAGKFIIDSVPDIVKSIDLTCNMENELVDVSKGVVSYDTFMKEQYNFIMNLVNEANSFDSSNISRPVSELGYCPHCKATVLSGKYGLYCSAKCGMTFYAFGKALSDSQYKKCVIDQKPIVIEYENKEKTKKYKRKLVYTGVAPFVTKGKDGSEVKRFGLQFDSEFVN